MALADPSSDPRRRGAIRVRGRSLQVRVSAGDDPVTGRRSYLTETISGTDATARKRAEKALTRLLRRVDVARTVESSISFREASGEWLQSTEVEESTRHTYQGYLTRTLLPAIGDTPLRDLNPRTLEKLYVSLRRCRLRCSDPKLTPKPPAHTCRPLAVSTVRQMHAVISGTMEMAVRWDWLDTNISRGARLPRAKAPEPDPPSSRQAALLLERAFAMDDDWGTLVWLVMTTGLRRAEVCGLRFGRIDFDEEIVDIRRTWVRGREKDTKTHQARRIALDSETVTLLREHRERVAERLRTLGTTLTDQTFVFSGLQTPDHSQPYSPNAVTQRYKGMAERAGIDTHIHALRHYSATELLTAGVDLRTVAGRLGHGAGGATTLKVYAAWVAASDRKAAEVAAARMPRPPRRAAAG
ncbi:site-specific integrase [Pseudonocardia oroxyli]|nr:site-specific integrase [Pseudonocardia oroxyli]